MKPVEAGRPWQHEDLPALPADLPALKSPIPPAPRRKVDSRAPALPERARVSRPVLPVFDEAGAGLPSVKRAPEAPRPRPAVPRPSPPPELPAPVLEPMLDIGRSSSAPPEPRVLAPSPSKSFHAFGELDVDLPPPPAPAGKQPSAPPPPSPMAFGEIDLGGVPVTDLSVALEPVGRRSLIDFGAGPEVTVPMAALRERRFPARRATNTGRTVLRWMLVGFAAAVLLAGVALQLTPYGAFGYLAISDLVRARDYAQAAHDTVVREDRRLAHDTYDEARAALEDAAAVRAALPRARSVDAYVAFLDAFVRVRFGDDATRRDRGNPDVDELPPSTRYVASALAAQAGEERDWDRARAHLEIAARTEGGSDDPIHAQLECLRGEIELAAQAPRAALEAFERALGGGDARAHFGLARAHARLGDDRRAREQVEATLAISPDHPGARLLRARLLLRIQGDRAAADVAAVLEGPSRAKASPRELAEGYALRGWLKLERGEVAAARTAFDTAVGLVPNEGTALLGQGEIVFREGRYAEALSRFEAAMDASPGSPDAVVSTAKAKLALGRLEDAKADLVAARAKFPSDLPVRLLLGDVELRLGHGTAAEQEWRDALPLADPEHLDAVAPYVSLARLLAMRGDGPAARAVLMEARAKLSASAPLERAFGDVAEMQGKNDEAIRYYRAALARDPSDAASHVRLAAVYRKLKRFDDAAAELERVRAVDEEFPGLALERGLLYEATGKVELAIEQFRGALAKAPNDPDLQLRIGDAYLAIGRPEDALAVLEKALEKRPTSADVHFGLGRAYLHRGGPGRAEALRHLKRAVELDPNRAELYVYLAWAASEATPPQITLAREALDKALSLDRLSGDAYWLRGVMERNEGAIADAIRDERRALALRPSRIEAHATLAECLEDKNDLNGAMAEWAKAVAADPSRPAWRFRYGRLLLEKRSAAEALPHLAFAAEQGEKLEPRPGWVAQGEFLAAEAYRKVGRKDEAMEHYRRFLEIAPQSSPDRRDARAALARLAR